jgi:hypothetical protein
MVGGFEKPWLGFALSPVPKSEGPGAAIVLAWLSFLRGQNLQPLN